MYSQAKSKLVANNFRTDEVENDIALQVIDSRLNEIYAIIQNNPQVNKQYVEKAIEPTEDSLSQLHNKVD